MPTSTHGNERKGRTHEANVVEPFLRDGVFDCCRRLLLAAPDIAFKLLFSNNSYGEVLPRLLGTVLLSIGAVFVQIVRLHIEELYTTTIIVRIPLIAVNLWLFIYSGNPLFLTLFVIVTVGVVLTITGYVFDQRSRVNDNRT